MIKYCNKCKVELIIGQNWTIGRVRQNSKICKNCIKNNNKKYYKKNKEKENKRCKEYNKNNKKSIKNRKKNYYINNIDKIKEYYHNNKHLFLNKVNKRRALKKQAIPIWADIEAIKDFYKNCPKGYHVDHYYPIQSDKVCGLHILENLQYLTAEENLSKGNKMPEEFYDN